MIIKKHTEFKVNNKLCYSEDIVDTDYKGYLVIDFVSMTTYPNVDALPVKQLVYRNIKEQYMIKDTFIIIGGVKDICLI